MKPPGRVPGRIPGDDPGKGTLMDTIEEDSAPAQGTDAVSPIDKEAPNEEIAVERAPKRHLVQRPIYFVDAVLRDTRE